MGKAEINIRLGFILAEMYYLQQKEMGVDVEIQNTGITEIQ